MNKILIVEDHETLGYVLVEYLKLHGFDAAWESSAEAGLVRMAKETPHLCLLDVSLPNMDGFELAKRIRLAHPGMPFIFLTARGLKVDRIRGLMLHADDYLVKPVDEEELVLRIRSVLRRTYGKPEEASPVYRIGQFVFEAGNHLLKSATGTAILTEKESGILQILSRQKEKLVTRNTILKEVWGKTDHFTARTMDVHLTKLRRHLSIDPSVSIVNVHGQGFILRES